MKTPVFIRVFSGDQLVEVRQFTADQIVLGSDESCSLRLQDALTSPVHASIDLEGGSYGIQDLGSATGTFVNGTKTLQQKLSSGDELRVGSFKLEFFIGIPKPKVNTAPAPVEPEPIVVKVQDLDHLPMVPQSANIEDPEPATDVEDEPRRDVKDEAVLDPGAPRGLESSAPAVEAGRPSAPSSKTPATSRSVDKPEGLVAGTGPDVQVYVTWNQHVLSTYRFAPQKSITMGSSHGADVLMPLLAGKGQQVVLSNLGGQWQVVPLSQSLGPGDVLRLEFENGVAVYITLANVSVKPGLAPWLDFSQSELAAFVVSMVFVGLLALYMGLYTPPTSLKDDELENLARVAVLLNEKLPDIKPTPQPVKTENPIVKEEKPAAKPQTNADEGRISEVRPKKLDQKKPKTLTSVKQGGSIKTGPKEGANAQSVQKDVKKEGLFAAFGTKGAQAQLDQAYGGAGELQGLANQATGAAGSNVDRPGEGLGSQFKDTGAGGKGTALQGIAGVGRGGNGFGNKGYGTGGLGAKTGTLVLPGGQGEEFVGTIDRDAIRRVVMSHIEEVRFCYEQALNTDQSAAGRVKISWQIGAGGSVISASVKETPDNLRGVANCLVNRLRAWIFPEPPNGSTPTVSYPFVFERK